MENQPGKPVSKNQILPRNRQKKKFGTKFEFLTLVGQDDDMLNTN